MNEYHPPRRRAPTPQSIRAEQDRANRAWELKPYRQGMGAFLRKEIADRNAAELEDED